MTKGSEMDAEDDLDRLLTLARRAEPAPAPDFMARVLQEAWAAQPAPAPPPQGLRAVRRPGLWARLAQALGGAAVAAGLGTAAMAGLALGYVQPDPVLNLAGSYGLAPMGEALDLLPGYDSLVAEE